MKPYSKITHAEWICYKWVDVTPLMPIGTASPEDVYCRSSPRPLDEAMALSGGSIKTLEPYLWALKDYMKAYQE